MSAAPKPAPRRRARASEIDEAVARIEAWGAKDHSAGFDPPLHNSLGHVLLRMASRRPSPVDPFLLPMA